MILPLLRRRSCQHLESLDRDLKSIVEAVLTDLQKSKCNLQIYKKIDVRFFFPREWVQCTYSMVAKKSCIC